MRPKGVQAVYDLMLGSEAEKAHAEGNPASLARAVKLISTVPRQVKADNYFARIGPQLVAIMRIGGERAASFRQAAAQTIGVMTIARPGAAQTCIYEHMLKPMLLMAAYESAEKDLPDESGDDNDGMVEEVEDENCDDELKSLIKEEEIGQMIEDLHTLLTHDTPSEQALLRPFLIACCPL